MNRYSALLSLITFFSIQATAQIRPCLLADLEASDSGQGFGMSVSLCGDDAAVGAPLDNEAGIEAGAVYVFKRNGFQWTELIKLMASDASPEDHFGLVSIGQDYLLVGAQLDDASGIDSGSAYVFKRDSSAWTEMAKLMPSDGEAQDHFGSVALSGDLAVIGAWGDDDRGDNAGAAYIFRRDGDIWLQES